MESDGAASSRRRSGGGVRSEHSSSTQGVYVPRVGEDREGVAPKCHCGVYAIPYLSRTESNPNRMFFGCPFWLRHLERQDDGPASVSKHTASTLATTIHLRWRTELQLRLRNFVYALGQSL
ncbi:hypothetical protein PIB30_034596 [Stylosanthes scabra]|uniref:Zinc finger GRF-type domain-containing protein n=1 Tax=Stylosanthes scabra TaxID=79078 RepID=A0ABU6VEE3_9FABA|nr:hypothetical protein [Stylosanthes scabra]